MSRNRIIAKVRVNADFKAMTAWLNAQGLSWTVNAPTGKGHPFLMIDHPSAGEPVKHTIACSPKGASSTDRKLASLKRALRNAGFPMINAP